MSEKPRIDLDKGQRAAVDSPVVASTNIIAGAGTGKTTVLVERYLALIETGIPIERLLALTFTLKAAGEMRERVRVEVAKRHPELARRLSRAWIMNFHQFGYRFIQENAPALGIDPGVDVISIAEFQRIQRHLRARFENGRIPGIPSDFGGEPPPPTKLGSLFDTLMNVVHHCRGIMLEPTALRAMVRGDDHPAYIARVDTVVALAREYEIELARRGLLDFSDMITIPARALMQDGPLARAYGDAFDHILVDEFQDTSAAQNELLRALSGGDFARVTVVGDRKQSIYRWRDARVENIREFPDPKPRELAMNYRSRQGILDLAHALVMREGELRDAAVPLQAHRGAGESDVLLFHPDGGQDRYADESEALGAWVDHLLGRVPAPAHWELAPLATPLEPHEIAVLLRRFSSNRLMPEMERVFQRRSIPFAIVGGANRAESRALESWHSWLSLLLPGDRAVDLVAALDAPPYAVSEASLAELFAAHEKRTDVLEILHEERVAHVQDARDATVMRELRASIEEAAAVWRARGFSEFLVWNIEMSPLRARLLRDGAQPAAVDELLRELLDLADGLAHRGELNLATFLDHLRASLDERKFREDGEAALPQGRVAVMTVHQAKGLEFPAVAVVGVVKGNAPSDSFLVSRESGLYFSDDTGGAWKRGKESAENHKLEARMDNVEERCVLYVALTRARDHLWVSASSVEGQKRYKSKEPARWLFTDLIECARELNVGREIRDVGGAAEIAARPALWQSTEDGVEEDVRAWVELRKRNVASATTSLSAGGLLTVTWSALARYEMCPWAFRLDREARIAGTPDEMALEDVRTDTSGLEFPKGVDPADFGAFVHAVLEQRQDMGDDLDYTIGRVAARYNFGKHAPTVIDLARARIRGACAAGLAGASEGARSELPFAVRTSNVLVHGVIDRLDTLKDGVLVTDYKLGAPHDSHHFQVAVYAWAAGQALGTNNVRARVVYLGHDPIRVDDVETESARVSALVEAMGKSLESGEFVAKPGGVCVTCEHRLHCAFAATTETPGVRN
jgi:DNA helicase-2/ATP-dependent DNA helicase PcrA